MLRFFRSCSSRLSLNLYPYTPRTEAAVASSCVSSSSSAGSCCELWHENSWRLPRRVLVEPRGSAGSHICAAIICDSVVTWGTFRGDYPLKSSGGHYVRSINEGIGTCLWPTGFRPEGPRLGLALMQQPTEAIVNAKELTFGTGLKTRHAEVDWRGKLFVGNILP